MHIYVEVTSTFILWVTEVAWITSYPEIRLSEKC